MRWELNEQLSGQVNMQIQDHYRTLNARIEP